MILKKITSNIFLQLVLIVFFAAIFRLSNLDLIEFKYDEALSTFQAFLFYIYPNVPQVGLIASTGMYNFPLFNYLLIIISLFSKNPQYISFIIALINVGMIALYFLLNKKLFSTSIAFVSAMTLAISPWAIIFSRKIWAQDLILLFAVPFYYYFLLILKTKKAKNLSILIFLLFLLVQLHASGIFLAISTFIIFIIFKIKLSRSSILRGLVWGFIFLIPFLIFEISSTPFCRDCVAFFEYQKLSHYFDIENFLRPFQILNGLNFRYLLGDDYSDFLKFSPILQPIIYIFILEIFIFIIIAICYFKNKNNKYYLLFLVTLIPLLYFVTRTPAYLHYYVIILPLVCLIYALLFNYLYSLRKNLTYKSFIILIFLFFFISKLIFTLLFFQFIEQKRDISGDYGPIFKLTNQTITQNIKQYIAEPDFNYIQQYSYVFINTPIFHQKLGEYFMNNEKSNLAVLEFQKALEDNQNDVYSLANLTYLFIQSWNIEEAKEGIKILSTKDATLSAKLQNILDNKKTISR